VLQPTVAAVREVAGLPTAESLLTHAASLPAAQADEQRILFSMYLAGDDEGILRRMPDLAARDRVLADGLREKLAGAYLRDVRLYRAAQQLEAIAAAHRSDQARFMSAHIAGRQRRLKDAARWLDDLAVRLPDDTLVARDQAQVLSLLGEHARAAAACERLLRMAPGDEFAAFLLARTRMQQGRLSDADRLLSSLLARNPRHGRAALHLGLLRLAEGDAAAAVARFIHARTVESRDASPYVAEAAARLLLGTRSEARRAVQGALKQNAGDPLAGLLDLLVAGGSKKMLVSAGSPQAAASLLPDLEREPLPASLGREIEHGASGAGISVANVLLALWSPQAALGWLARHDTAGHGPLAESTAIRALAAAGDAKSARRRAARLAADPSAQDLAGTQAQLAEAAARLGDPAAAIAAMREAVRRAPGVARIRTSFGNLYEASGRWPEAVAEYREALRLAPVDPRLANQLAMALALSGERSNLQEALTLAEAGLALRPDYMTRALLLGTRADALYRLGRESEAYAAYRELSTAVGGIATPEPWHRLGALALEAGDRATARRAFEEALDYGRDYSGREQAVAALARLAVGPGGT
jgi:tetratricopeptide (TPR) repeat protein